MLSRLLRVYRHCHPLVDAMTEQALFMLALVAGAVVTVLGWLYVRRWLPYHCDKCGRRAAMVMWSPSHDGLDTEHWYCAKHLPPMHDIL